MKTVYFKSGEAHWKYELEDEEYDNIIRNIQEDKPDVEEMLSDSLEILRDISAMDEDEMDEDDQIDQTISVAYIWYYFNHIAEGEAHITGDVALIEDDDGEGVTVLAAADVVEE